MNNPQPGLLAAGWRHKWLVLGVIVLVTGLAIGWSLLRPQDPRYLAAATVVIQERITAESVGQQGASVGFLRSQLEILRSPVVAEAALEIVHEADPSALDDELPEVTIVGNVESPLVTVEAIASTPELAVAYANAIAEAYREVSQRQATSTTQAQLAHIDAQVEGIDERLREIQRELANLVAGDSDLSELQAQSNDAVATIARLQAQLLDGEGLSAEETSTIRQQIQDNRQVMAVYREVLASASSSPERRALDEEQSRQVDRRAGLLTLRDQIAVDVGLAPDSIALVQSAPGAVELAGIQLARVLGAALIVGTAAGLGLAYLLSVSRRTLTDRSEPGAILDAPLLVDVPDFEQEQLASPVPVRDHPRSAAAEAFRFASGSLEVSARARGAHAIFVASSTIGRGKTTTVVNTAIAAAVNDRSVLVLDCDFGNQEATRLLVGDHDDVLLGVTDIIEGQAMAKDATHEVGLPTGGSLHVMPRGTRPSLAAKILQSTQARDLVSLLTGRYDLVIIDGPPMLQVAYASTLAELADAILVVTEHRSRYSELVELKSRLDLVGTPVLGYVYNRSPLRREMTVSEGSMMDILGDVEESAGVRARHTRGTG